MCLQIALSCCIVVNNEYKFVHIPFCGSIVLFSKFRTNGAHLDTAHMLLTLIRLTKMMHTILLLYILSIPVCIQASARVA